MTGKYLAPGEARRLLSALLGVLGLLALGAFFAFLVVPGLRARPLPAPEPTEGLPGDTGWLDPTDYPPTPREVVPPIDPRTVLVPSAPLLARGRALYGQLCASCHGAEGRGDGPGAKGLVPPVRNFTRPEGWKHGPRLADLYRTLEEGLKGSSMASYAQLPRKDRMALAHQVRTFLAFEPGPEDPAALAALERTFAAAGETLPNRIPVRQAAGLLVREHPAPAPLRLDLPVLRAAVLDPVRAAATLEGLPGWRSRGDALARGVAATLGANGFAPAVATWPPGRWEDLRSALARPPGDAP
jgi:mono/diheme cytochrome c family protein